jgi:hypothetical protein
MGNGNELVWHNWCRRAPLVLGYDPRTRVGVVVLSNTETPTGVDDIGLYLLETRIPLTQAPKQHTEIRVDPSCLMGTQDTAACPEFRADDHALHQKR